MFLDKLPKAFLEVFLDKLLECMENYQDIPKESLEQNHGLIQNR